MTPLGKYIKKSGLGQKHVAAAAGLTPERLNGLCNDQNDLLYADDFFAIVNAIDEDINNACKEVFRSFELKQIEAEWKSDLGRFLFKNAKPTKSIAEATRIKPIRLSKLLNDSEKRPYAWELYAIALILEKEPSEIFESLYGSN